MSNTIHIEVEKPDFTTPISDRLDVKVNNKTIGKLYHIKRNGKTYWCNFEHLTSVDNNDESYDYINFLLIGHEHFDTIDEFVFELEKILIELKPSIK